MSDTNERSVASSGSQPVAWAVEFDGGVEPFCLSFHKGKAIDEAGGVGRVVPLYRSPTPTDEERDAIGEAIRLGDQWGWSETLRGLLERLG